MDYIFGFFTEYGATILDAAAYVIAAASLIANITPTDADNKALALIGKIVNALGLNLFRFVQK